MCGSVFVQIPRMALLSIELRNGLLNRSGISYKLYKYNGVDRESICTLYKNKYTYFCDGGDIHIASLHVTSRNFGIFELFNAILQSRTTIYLNK